VASGTYESVSELEDRSLTLSWYLDLRVQGMSIDTTKSATSVTGFKAVRERIESIIGSCQLQLSTYMALVGLRHYDSEGWDSGRLSRDVGAFPGSGYRR